MGLLWTMMGGVCVVLPDLVVKLSFKKEVLPAAGTDGTKAVRLLTQCFGAQAVCCGVLLLTSKMDQRAHKIWLGVLAPFFVFDYVFWRNGYLTDAGALGDLAGNLVFAGCSLTALLNM